MGRKKSCFKSIFSNKTEEGYRKVDGGSLLVTGTLFRNIFPLAGTKALPSPGDTEKILRNFYLELTGNDTVWDSYIPHRKMFFGYNDTTSFSRLELYEPYEYKYAMFGIEFYNMVETVLNWLEPQEVGSGHSQLSKEFRVRPFFFPEKETKHIFQYRCEELSYSPDIFESGKFTTLIKSPGLMSLCWAEIWHAVEHDIKAGVCPVCGDIYLFPKQNYRKAYCDRSKCLYLYNALRAGGLDAYRQQEAERKRIKRGSVPGRKPGRPPKKSD